MDGLTAAAGAAAGTGHDLHEVILHLAGAQGLDELAGVLQAAGHGHPDGGALNVEGGFLPAVQTPDVPEGVRRRIDPGDQVVSRAQSRFHHAAGGAEDHAGAGTHAQGRVKLLFRQGVDVDVLRADHPVDFPGGQHQIHVRIAAGVLHHRQIRLLLLGKAGHHGDAANPMGVHADEFGEVALGHRAEHLLGALGGGQILYHIRVLALQEPDPARAAGGEHGPGVLVRLCQMLQEFAALFHNGQVGGEVGVKHIPEAHPPQGSHQPLDGGLLPGQTQALAPGGPDGGGNLHHRHQVLVAEHVEGPLGVIPLPQGPHRTVGDALAAQGAVRFPDGPAAGDVHGGPGTGVGQIPDVQALDLVAHLDTAHTLDALAGVPDQGEGVVPPGGGNLFMIVQVGQTQVVCQLLQLTVAAADAVGAVAVMLAQNQLHIHPPGLPDPGGVGIDLHAFPDVVVAGGHQLLDAGDLHHAHPAGGDFVQILQVAQAGHVDAHAPGGFQN